MFHCTLVTSCCSWSWCWICASCQPGVAPRRWPPQRAGTWRWFARWGCSRRPLMKHQEIKVSVKTKILKWQNEWQNTVVQDVTWDVIAGTFSAICNISASLIASVSDSEEQTFMQWHYKAKEAVAFYYWLVWLLPELTLNEMKTSKHKKDDSSLIFPVQGLICCCHGNAGSGLSHSHFPSFFTITSKAGRKILASSSSQKYQWI